MSKPALLADHIDRQSEAILAQWRETVEIAGRVPEAESLSRAEFYDHVPAILDHLAERLRGQPWRRGVGRPGPRRASLASGVRHCRDRQRA